MDAFKAQPGDVVLRLNDRTEISQTAFALLMERTEGVPASGEQRLRLGL